MRVHIYALIGILTHARDFASDRRAAFSIVLVGNQVDYACLRAAPPDAYGGLHTFLIWVRAVPPRPGRGLWSPFVARCPRRLGLWR